MAKRIYGPIPPSFEAEQNESESEQVVSSSQDVDEVAIESDESYGPVLPVHLTSYPSTAVADDSDESDQPVYGPTPDTTNSQQQKLEERALEMRIRNCSRTSTSNDQPVRQEWMIELPSIVNKTSLGLTARKFRMKEGGPDFSDRSAWTKNPNEPDSSQSFKHTFEIKTKIREEEEHEHELIAKRLKKKHKREKSLLELHQKKRKKEKKKKKEKERRPFARDTDLQVNRFDDAKKKVLIKKAQLLDTRFSTGKDAKYL